MAQQNKTYFAVKLSQNKTFHAAACMSGPFLFLLISYSLNDSVLKCSQVLCHLKICWANETTVAVVQVPGLVPIPLNQLVLAVPTETLRSPSAASVTTRIVINQTAFVANTVDHVFTRTVRFLTEFVPLPFIIFVPNPCQYSHFHTFSN